MAFIRSFISRYRPRFIRSLVYMMQATEYKSAAFWEWFLRTADFSSVERRRRLVKTDKAKLSLLWLWSNVVIAWLLLITGGFWLLNDTATSDRLIFGAILLLILLAAPAILAASLAIFISAFNVAQKPLERKLVERGRQAFLKHPGIKIAIAGSYGKTTAKEILRTVFSQGKTVAANPGNMNVPLTQAKYALGLSGKEDVVLIEYGEGKPGDIAHYVKISQPTMGVITGIAPAHLDQYPNLEAAARDIFSLAAYLQDQQVYINGDSKDALPYTKATHQLYSQAGLGQWKVSGTIKVMPDGTSFTLQKGRKRLKFQSGLLGRHLIGVQVLAAVLGLELGLSEQQIIDGIAACVPFEHRMQPRQIGGAWIIDDTYNGNIEGMRAGIALLKELPAKRRIYVTPGLVDQGVETVRVHAELGTLLADGVDEVVLMQNSATKLISSSLYTAGFKGKLTTVDDPLNFYLNVESVVAAGDVMLMQNDWTDNYA